MLRLVLVTGKEVRGTLAVRMSGEGGSGIEVFFRETISAFISLKLRIIS